MDGHLISENGTSVSFFEVLEVKRLFSQTARELAIPDVRTGRNVLDEMLISKNEASSWEAVLAFLAALHTQVEMLETRAEA